MTPSTSRSTGGGRSGRRVPRTSDRLSGPVNGRSVLPFLGRHPTSLCELRRDMHIPPTFNDRCRFNTGGDKPRPYK
jgi:hypothetical protein